MFIDEEKIRQKSKVSLSKLPSAKFKKGNSREQSFLESAKLVMGIVVIVSMLMGLGALIYTFVNEAPKTMALKTQKPQKASYENMQITYRPKNQQQ